MSTSKEAPTDDLKMSAAEFDKMMRKALQAAPQEAPKPKQRSKVANARKPAKKAVGK